MNRLEPEGELLVETLVGVLGSYTVEGSRVGGSEGILGGAVTDAGGSYTGERGLARRGLEAGEREGDDGRREGESGCGCGAAPLTVAAAAAAVVVVVMLSLREKLGWWWCWGLSRWERLLLVVDWDQRLMLAVPSRKGPMPSAAPLAALERRRAEGGGVARRWGLDGSGFASLSDSEAVRWTVTTDDEEMEAARDEGRR